MCDDVDVFISPIKKHTAIFCSPKPKRPLNVSTNSSPDLFESPKSIKQSKILDHSTDIFNSSSSSQDASASCDTAKPSSAKERSPSPEVTVIFEKRTNKSETIAEFRQRKLKERGVRDGDVVRNKDDRALMHGTDCGCCAAYYNALDLSPASRARRIDKVSRHRYAEQPNPPTPEHYWEMEFPSEDELRRRGLIIDKSPRKSMSLEALKSNYEKELTSLKLFEKDREKHVSNRQTLESQRTENKMELDLLEEDATVFKLIGAVLVKVDLVEARQQVEKRLEYIEAEIKRVEQQLTDSTDKIKSTQATLMRLQQQLQKLATQGAGKKPMISSKA